MRTMRSKLRPAVLAIAIALGAAGAASLAVPLLAASPARSATTGVVIVNVRSAYGGGAGTGIVLTSSGKVLTNNHVIRGAQAIRVTDTSTQRTYRATVSGYSVARDVALLQLKGARGLPTARFGSGNVGVGDAVTAVGNAGGTGVLRVKTGRVERVGRTITVTDEDGTSARLTGLIQTSAPLRPGDSGGPLLADGKVIGMDAAASRTFSYHESGGEGYAIPVDTVLRIARQIDAGKRTSNVHVGPTAFLGVSLAGASFYEARGALVHGVASGSPAARAGIGAGDVITSLGGRAVQSAAHLRTLVLRRIPGQVVSVTWDDDFAGSQSARVKLASGPPQ